MINCKVFDAGLRCVPTFKHMQELKKLGRQFNRVSYKLWLSLFLTLAIISLFALRSNNQQMIKLRNDVYAADKAGSGVEPALDKLRRYVYGHMNTNLSSGGNAIKPPIQLKYTYDRLAAAAQAQANNSSLYTEAENYCQAQIPASVSISGRGRITCVQEYILSHGGKQASAIPTALYQYDFVSPAWSPDFAGWSLVMTTLLGLASVFGFLKQNI